MIMKKIVKIMSLAVVLIVTVSSCDLNKYPNDSIEQSQAMKSIKDATALNNGLYAKLRLNVGGIFTFSTDVQADQLNATLDFGNRNGSPHRWTNFLADDYTIRDVWAGYYDALTNVNNVLNNIGKIQTTSAAEEATVKLYRGEAYLMRAFYYHQLVLRYAKAYDPATASSDLGVPLMLTFDIKLKPKRSSVAEVYTQILSDITQAKTLLAGVAGAQSSTKLTIDCALALEARVNLCMRNFTGAITDANALINSGTYPLINNVDDFKKMWVNDVSTEVIFQMFLDKPNELANTNSIYLGYNAALNKYAPDFVPQKWVIDLYDAADIRKAVYLEKKAVIIQGTDYPGIYCINKYPGNPALFTAATTNYQQKPKVFRIAEMYLISAEAAAQTPATEAAALNTLNQLRVKRGIAPLTGLTGTALMNAIKEERTREMLCEGTRLDDLKRWKMGFSRSTPQNINLINTGADFDQKTVPAGDNKFVWGIPTNDVTTNSNIVQNIGW